MDAPLGSPADVVLIFGRESAIGLFLTVGTTKVLRSRQVGLATINRGAGHDGRHPTLFLNHTFLQLQRVDLGIQPSRLLTGRVALSPRYPAGPAAAQFFDRVVAVAAETPGVVTAAAITQLPLSGAQLGSTFLVEPGTQSRRIDADLRGITPRYFEVAGAPLLLGRPFGAQDVAAAPAVAIIDATLAHRLRGLTRQGWCWC